MEINIEKIMKDSDQPVRAQESFAEPRAENISRDFAQKLDGQDEAPRRKSGVNLWINSRAPSRLMNQKTKKDKSKRKPEFENMSSKFMSDIDNFDGVKDLKNYCIISLNDNNDHVEEVAVGVMQCYNKVNGSEIDMDDVKRIRCLATFVGGLTMKAHCFMDTMNMIVGMIQNVQNSYKEIRRIDTTPGLGDFQKC